MYVEASDLNNPNVTFALDLPNASFPLEETHILEFSYHMYGSTMGALEVLVETNVSGVLSWTVVWSAEGDQGNSWQVASVTVPISTSSLRFLGTTGKSMAAVRIVALRCMRNLVVCFIDCHMLLSL